ncbi:MAG: alanine dehydrogenase [Flavobacteriales bacterium]|nr:alanine dehydrogenase [Flavobacteriales bacterium]
MKLGIIREGKDPPDKRVPLGPQHCVEVMQKWPHVEVVVQSSAVRDISDDEYREAGISIVEDVSDRDILMGVKEVPYDDLIPKKKYFFFSHTYKEQPYNAKLLKTILDKKIQLIDYELLKKKSGARLLGFGRYAGIVGTYNAFYAWGKKFGTFELKRAIDCHDREEAESELKKIVLPDNFKLIVTGKGRVGKGSREILELVDIEEVSVGEFLNISYSKPCYCHIDVEDYNKHPELEFDRDHFFANEEKYISDFYRFAKVADMYIACHYWANNAPQILTKEQIARDDFHLKVIADISCDIKEPIASTLRASTIAEPVYGYNKETGEEMDFMDPNSLGVMAVDNLPCELSRDASIDFGNNLISNVFPHLFGDDTERIIERASETDLNGELMPDFEYLTDYVKGA